MIINKMVTELVEECELKWEAVVVQAEDEEDRDRTHAESMQDNTAGMIVGTTKTVPTIDLFDMQDETVEAVNKIGVEAEVFTS